MFFIFAIKWTFFPKNAKMKWEMNTTGHPSVTCKGLLYPGSISKSSDCADWFIDWLHFQSQLIVYVFKVS